MVNKKQSARERLEKYLPLHTQQGTCITGIINEDWMCLDKKLWPYSKCCQDPRNWEGRGDFKMIAGDPWMVYGYVKARGCYCKVCGTHVIAHEYSKEKLEASK